MFDVITMTGLGKAYALFFASRGASVVVNDLGGGPNGGGRQSSVRMTFCSKQTDLTELIRIGQAADQVVRLIERNGGRAVADYNDVKDGEQIIRTAIEAFGRVDILINNAGILRDISFKNISDQDWDLIMQVHVIGAYKCARAAFPYMREQKYGRIISTASAAGLFGSFGQTNYSAAKLAQVGFTETLAKEGLKYNIRCNTIAPIAASRLTAIVMDEDILRRLQPEWVVPLVAFLCHTRSDATGGIFEVGAGHIAQLRWERSQGAYLRPDDSFTQGSLLHKWSEVVNFSQADHPDGPADFAQLLNKTKSIPPSPSESEHTPDFNGRVAIVTGGAAGIGQAYSIHFARYGAKVVVNDLVDPRTTVDKIRAAGGNALGIRCSAESGETIVKAAIDAFGRVDIVINNAGILRDAAFHKMTDKQFLDVLNVHLHSTFKVSKAAWPYMQKQRYGRIINTTSTSGIYGNFGQANYAAAKCGILGFSRALALEGKKYNIKVNTVAPYAGTGLSKGALPDELFQGFKPQYLCPLVGLLGSDNMIPEPSTGGLFESGTGWVAETRWQRSGGVAFPADQPLTPEMVMRNWPSVTNFDDGRADHPREPADGTAKIMANLQEIRDAAPTKGNNSYLDKIAAELKRSAPGTEFSWAEKDVVLYSKRNLPLFSELD
jgi:multifunctional beta-oxidation protein